MVRCGHSRGHLIFGPPRSTEARILQYKAELERILTGELRKREQLIRDVSIVANGEFAVYNVADRYTVRRLSGAAKEFLRSGRLAADSPEDCLISDSVVPIIAPPTALRRLLFSNHYKCDDCGGTVGMRSRRRKWAERYIFALLFLKPVRCARCFRRDYCWISTPTCDRIAAEIELTRHLWCKAA